MNEDLQRRIKALVDTITERHGPGPLFFVSLTCDRCGKVTDLLIEENPEGWIGGPPDYCPRCVVK